MATPTARSCNQSGPYLERFDPAGRADRGLALVRWDFGHFATRRHKPDRHRHLDEARLAILDLDLAVARLVADLAGDIDRAGRALDADEGVVAELRRGAAGQVDVDRHQHAQDTRAIDVDRALVR